MSAAVHSLAFGLGWVGPFLPRVLPSGWREIPGADGAKYVAPDGMSVIVSGAFELDGKRWLHVSCSRRERLPSWEDLRAVKDRFIGLEALALQVLPPQSRYINLNPHVLHLWHCVDAEPVPDFARGGGTI
jgi:hypothetical protein